MIRLLLFENFNKKKTEIELIEDLLLELIDKYKMSQMQMSEENYTYEYNDDLGVIQYLITPSDFANNVIHIYFEYRPSTLIDDLYKDVQSFVKRIKKYGYKVTHCNLIKASEDDRIESIIIKLIYPANE